MNDLELEEIGLGRIMRWNRLAQPAAQQRPAAAPPPPAPQAAPPRQQAARAAPAPAPAAATQPVQPQREAAAQPQPQASAPQPAAAAAAEAADEAGEVALMSLEQLAAAAANCSKCGLCEKRTQAVVGVGDTQPGGILFVGEGPGEEEDRRGEPFVGPAGRLLDSMLAAIGQRRGEKVYIANAVKCRPPNNRTPHADELAACKPYLFRQIELIQPRLIVGLGKVAGNVLLDTHDQQMFRMRARKHAYRDIPLFITYHPSYYLHRPEEKVKGWEDWVELRKMAAA